MKNNSIFNTPLEIGLRSLYILIASYPNKCSLDRLVLLDYMSIYIRDIKLDSECLHPEYPMRSIEIYERRNGLKNGLLIMISKGIIEMDYSDGIAYRANSSTKWFIDGIENKYSSLLLKNTKLVVEYFEDKNDSEIEIFVKNNIEKWGQEFLELFSYQQED